MIVVPDSDVVPDVKPLKVIPDNEVTLDASPSVVPDSDVVSFSPPPASTPAPAIAPRGTIASPSAIAPPTVGAKYDQEATDAIVNRRWGSSPIRRAIADPLVSLAKGVVSVPNIPIGIADAFTGGRVGKAIEENTPIKLKETQETLSTLYSPEARQAQERVAEGFDQGIAPGIKSVIENPSTIVSGAIESTPSMFAGGAIAKGARLIPAIAKLGKVAAPIASGAIGEGLVTAGQNIEQVREQTDTGLLTPKQVALNAGAGALTGAIGVLGGKVAQRLGLADVDTLMAGGNGAKRTLMNVFGGMVSEGLLEELPQSIQEQVAQNLSLGKPWNEGVAESGAMGAIIGGIMGAGANLVSRPTAKSKSDALKGAQPAILPPGVQADLPPQAPEPPAPLTDAEIAEVNANPAIIAQLREVQASNSQVPPENRVDLEFAARELLAQAREEMAAQVEANTPTIQQEVAMRTGGAARPQDRLIEVPGNQWDELAKKTQADREAAVTEGVNAAVSPQEPRFEDTKPMPPTEPKRPAPAPVAPAKPISQPVAGPVLSPGGPSSTDSPAQAENLSTTFAELRRGDVAIHDGKPRTVSRVSKSERGVSVDFDDGTAIEADAGDTIDIPAGKTTGESAVSYSAQNGSSPLPATNLKPPTVATPKEPTAPAKAEGAVISPPEPVAPIQPQAPSKRTEVEAGSQSTIEQTDESGAKFVDHITPSGRKTIKFVATTKGHREGDRYDAGMAVKVVTFEPEKGDTAPLGDGTDVEYISEIVGKDSIIVGKRRATDAELKEKRKRFERDQEEFGANSMDEREAKELGYVRQGDLYVFSAKPSPISEKSPVMQEYDSIKAGMPANMILAMKMGDFYEIFGDDAKTAAKILGVSLTKRNGIPMAGFPVHSAETYFKKLDDAGRNVATTDFTSPISAKPSTDTATPPAPEAVRVADKGGDKSLTETKKIQRGQYQNKGVYVAEVMNGREKGVIDPKNGGTPEHVDSLISEGIDEITVHPNGSIQQRDRITARLKDLGWNQWDKDGSIWQKPTTGTAAVKAKLEATRAEPLPKSTKSDTLPPVSESRADAQNKGLPQSKPGDSGSQTISEIPSTLPEDKSYRGPQADEYSDPRDIRPYHPLVMKKGYKENPFSDNVKGNRETLASLIRAFRNKTYQGPPVLLLNEEALTGTHRILAAKKAGVDVPVFRMTTDSEVHDVIMSEIKDKGHYEDIPDILRAHGLEDGAKVMDYEIDRMWEKSKKSKTDTANQYPPAPEAVRGQQAVQKGSADKGGDTSLTVLADGKPVGTAKTFQEASVKWGIIRNKAMSEGMGQDDVPGVELADDSGKVIAHVSWNGKVFEGPMQQAGSPKLLYDNSPTKTAAVKAKLEATRAKPAEAVEPETKAPELMTPERVAELIGLSEGDLMPRITGKGKTLAITLPRMGKDKWTRIKAKADKAGFEEGFSAEYGDGTIQPGLRMKEVVTESKLPESMTPEERAASVTPEQYIEMELRRAKIDPDETGSLAARDRAIVEGNAEEMHAGLLEDMAKLHKPLNAKSVETYFDVVDGVAKIPVPFSRDPDIIYVREGDRYVYRSPESTPSSPESTVAPSLPDQLNAGTAVKPRDATYVRVNGTQVLPVADVDTLKGAGPFKSAEWGIKGRSGFVAMAEGKAPARPVAKSEALRGKKPDTIPSEAVILEPTDTTFLMMGSRRNLWDEKGNKYYVSTFQWRDPSNVVGYEPTPGVLSVVIRKIKPDGSHGPDIRTDLSKMKLYGESNESIHAKAMIEKDEDNRRRAERSKSEALKGKATTSKSSAESAASRFKPKEKVVFEKPYVGPSGVSLIAYEWQWKPEEYVDKRGEDRVKRVSNWDEADMNAETGRMIVHQFIAQSPDGSTKTVSAESAMQLLGYQSKVGGGSLPSLVSAVKTLAKLKMERDKLRSQSELNNEIMAEVDKLLPPKAVIKEKESIIGGDKARGIKTFDVMIGDESARYYEKPDVAAWQKDAPMFSRVKAEEEAVSRWRMKRMKDQGYVDVSKYKIQDLDDRIKRQEVKITKINSATSSTPVEAPTAKGEEPPTGKAETKAPELMTPDEWQSQKRKEAYESALADYNSKNKPLTVKGLLAEGGEMSVYEKSSDRTPVGKIAGFIETSAGSFGISPSYITAHDRGNGTRMTNMGWQNGKLKLSDGKKLLMSDLKKAIAWANEEYKPQPDKDYYNDEEAMDEHIAAVSDAIKNKKPFLARLYDDSVYGYYVEPRGHKEGVPPAGYVKDGDRYVFKAETPLESLKAKIKVKQEAPVDLFPEAQSEAPTLTQARARYDDAVKEAAKYESQSYDKLTQDDMDAWDLANSNVEAWRQIVTRMENDAVEGTKKLTQTEALKEKIAKTRQASTPTRPRTTPAPGTPEREAIDAENKRLNAAYDDAFQAAAKHRERKPSKNWGPTYEAWDKKDSILQDKVQSAFEASKAPHARNYTALLEDAYANPRDEVQRLAIEVELERANADRFKLYDKNKKAIQEIAEKKAIEIGGTKEESQRAAQKYSTDAMQYPLTDTYSLDKGVEVALKSVQYDTWHGELSDAIGDMELGNERGRINLNLKNMSIWTKPEERAKLLDEAKAIDKMNQAALDREAKAKAKQSEIAEKAEMDKARELQASGSLLWILGSDNKWRPVEAKPIQIKDAPWGKFWIRKDSDKSGWNITDESTGQRVGFGPTRTDAIADATAKLKSVGEAKFKKIVAESIKNAPPKPDISKSPAPKSESLKGGKVTDKGAVMPRKAISQDASTDDTDAPEVKKENGNDSEDIKRLRDAIQSRYGDQVLPVQELREARPEGSEFEALDKVADAFGSRIVWYSEGKGWDKYSSEGWSGFPVPVSGSRAAGESELLPSGKATIYLNVNAKSPLIRVLGHELTHRMQSDNPGLYNEFQSIARNYIKTQEYLRGYLKGINDGRISEGLPVITDGEALAEFFPDLIGEYFQDRSFWNMVGRENPSLMRKIATYLADFIQKIKGALSDWTGGMDSNFIRDAGIVRQLAAEMVSKYAKDNPVARRAMAESEGEWLPSKRITEPADARTESERRLLEILGVHEHGVAQGTAESKAAMDARLEKLRARMKASEAERLKAARERNRTRTDELKAKLRGEKVDAVKDAKDAGKAALLKQAVSVGEMLKEYDGGAAAQKIAEGRISLRAAVNKLVKANESEHAQARKELVETINAKLPDIASRKLRLFMSMLTRNQITDKSMDRALARIDAIAEKEQKRNLVKAIKEVYAKASTSMGVNVLYRQRIKRIMEGFLLTKPSAATLADAKELADFLDQERNSGSDMDLTLNRHMARLIRALSGTPLIDMPVASLEDLFNQIGGLGVIGRIYQQAKTEGYKASQDAAIASLAGSVKIEEHLRRTVSPLGTDELSVVDKFRNLMAATSDIMKKWYVYHMPMDVVFDLLDGAKHYAGTNYRLFKSRIDIAYSGFRGEMHRFEDEMADKLKELGLTHDKKAAARIQAYAYDQQATGREKLLNTLSDRTAEGEAEANRILDAIKLTDNEMKFYTWAREKIEANRGAIERVMNETYNTELVPVENYWPMMTDWDRTEKTANIFGLEMDENGEFVKTPEPTGGLKKNVNASFTVKRKGAGDQILKMNAFDNLHKHIQDVNYYVHVGPTVKYLQEIANKDEYGATVGSIGQKIVREYLDTMARQGGMNGSHILRWVDSIRNNIGVGTLGLRLSSILIQPSSFFDGAGMIGGRWAFKGALDATQKDWHTFIVNNMTEIKDRVGGEWALREAELKSHLAKWGFWPLKMFDQLTATAIAAGAYEKNLHDRGLEVDFDNPDAEAIAYAQLIVGRTQTRSDYKDQPLAVTRGALMGGSRTLARAIYQFQSFSLNKFSYMMHDGLYSAIKNKEPARGVAIMAWTAMAFAMEEGIRAGLRAAPGGSGDDTEPEDMAQDFFMNYLQIIPLFGSLVSALQYNQFPAPVIKTMSDAASGLKSVMTSKSAEAKQRGAARLAGSVGTMAGIPGTSQAAQWARNTIKSDPEEVTAMIRDEVKGLSRDTRDGALLNLSKQMRAKAIKDGLIDKDKVSQMQFYKRYRDSFKRIKDR